MGAVGRGTEPLAMSEFSSRHMWRRVCFVKTGHTVHPPECPETRHYWTRSYRTCFIETSKPGKVNRFDLTGRLTTSQDSNIKVSFHCELTDRHSLYKPWIKSGRPGRQPLTGCPRPA